jgi:hypothetical protein
LVGAAFDLVDESLLVEKLRKYGANDRTCQWLKSYLTGRMQLVQVGMDMMELILNPYGVPQGGGLSPILFVIFTADMPEV